MTRKLIEAMRQYDSSPLQRDFIVSQLKQLSFTETANCIFSSINEFDIKYTESIIDILFLVFPEPEQRHRFAFLCTQFRSPFFFCCCCDHGVFDVDTVDRALKDMLDEKQRKEYMPDFKPEFEILIGPDKNMHLFKQSKAEYEAERQDCWAELRRKRRYHGAEPIDLALIEDDLETFKKLVQNVDHEVSFLMSFRMPLQQCVSASFLSIAILFHANKCIQYLIDNNASVTKSNSIGWRPVHSAAFVGDIELFEKLISKGARVLTGTICAAILGHQSQMIDYLVEKHGLSITDDFLNNLSSLWLAIESRDYYSLDILCKEGFDPNLDNFSFFKPVYLQCCGAPYTGQALNYMGEQLIYKDPDDVSQAMIGFTGQDEKYYEQVPFKGMKLISIASSHGYLDIVELLLDLGADIEGTTGLKETPLHLACMNGWADIVALLKKRGANISAEDKSGKLPLHYAAIHNFPDIVELFMTTKLFASGLLNMAITAGSLDVVEYELNLLLKTPDFQPSLFNKFVISAITSGSEKVLKILISKGANVKDMTFKGCHPIVQAVRNGSYGVVKVALENGMNPNASDGETTALQEAVIRNDSRMVRIFLENGVDPEIATKAYRLAKQLKHQKVIKAFDENKSSFQTCYVQ